MTTNAPLGSASAARPRTVLDTLRRATTFLEARGGATPRLDAEVLLAHVLATDRVGVYLRFDGVLTAAEMDHYRGLVRRRAEKEPVAYLTGRREFWSRPLTVSPDVLIPRPETELLVERALAGIADHAAPLAILDLGTGSGAIALALASELPRARVTALDVSRAAVAIAERNATSLGVDGRVTFLVADWMAGLAPHARFDVIVSNPPYVASAALAGLDPEVRCEPRLALDGGADGMREFQRLVPAAATRLAPGGRLLVEVGEGQALTVAALFRQSQLADVACHADLAGVARVIAGRSEGRSE